MQEIFDLFLWGYFRPDIWVYIVYALTLTHITIASVTIFLHRCQAHRALTLHPIMSHFFRFWLWMTTAIVTREWVAIHRKHHAKAETEEDPHSPQVHGIGSILFLGVLHYARAKHDQVMVKRYGYGAPNDWVENKIYNRFNRSGVTLMALVNTALFGFIPGMMIWTVQMAWIPFWAAGVINGIGHFWGYRNFQPQDESRNISPVGVLIGGEELHNNHHAFPTSARLSNRWYEFDIGWFYIRLMEKLSLAKVRRVAPKLLSGDSRASCDLEMLQSIIANRLEVVSRFAKSMKKVCYHELQGMQSKVDLPSQQVVNNWLQGLDRRLSSPDKKALENFIDNSPLVEKINELKLELTALWEDSTASSEELVKRLRQWCGKAEKSGVKCLQQFALELRGYQSA